MYQSLHVWMFLLQLVSIHEMRIQSANMGNISKYSSVTLAVEASENPSIGLYQSTSKSRQRIFQVSCRSEKHNYEGTMLLGRNNFGRPPFTEPLSSRAWTLQETVLARRVVRFAKGQVWWRCQEHECNERDPDALCSDRGTDSTMWQVAESNFVVTQGSPFFKTPKLRRRLQAFRHLIVMEFNARRITHPTDVLPTISGLAKEFQRHLKQKHAAGFWLCDIHSDLLWHSPEKGAILRNTYVAPSWSLASVNFSTSWKRGYLPDYSMFDMDYHKSHTPIAEVLDVAVVNAKNDPFGQVEYGHLRIRAPFQEVCSCHITDYFFDCLPIPVLENDSDDSHHQTSADACEAMCRAYESNIETFAKRPCCKVSTVRHENLLFLHITSCVLKTKSKNEVLAYGLILKIKDQQQTEFHRIGNGYYTETVKTSEIWPSLTLNIM